MSSYIEEENVGSSYLEPAFPWEAPECLEATSKRQNAKGRDRKDSAARRELEGSSAQQGRAKAGLRARLFYFAEPGKLPSSKIPVGDPKNS